MSSFSRSLQKPGTELVREFPEQLADPVGTAYQDLSRLFLYPVPAVCRECVAAAVATALPT